MKQKDNRPPIYGVFSPMCAALLGVDLLGLIQLTGLNNLDKRLTTATILFAVSLPLLALYMLNDMYESLGHSAVEVWYQERAFLLGVASTLVGLGALISHLSEVAGWLFGALCTVAVILHTHYVRKANSLDDT